MEKVRFGLSLKISRPLKIAVAGHKRSESWREK